MAKTRGRALPNRHSPNTEYKVEVALLSGDGSWKAYWLYDTVKNGEKPFAPKLFHLPGGEIVNEAHLPLLEESAVWVEPGGAPLSSEGLVYSCVLRTIPVADWDESLIDDDDDDDDYDAEKNPAGGTRRVVRAGALPKLFKKYSRLDVEIIKGNRSVRETLLDVIWSIDEDDEDLTEVFVTTGTTGQTLRTGTLIPFDPADEVVVWIF